MLTTVEIILFAVGMILLLASFAVPAGEKTDNGETLKTAEGQIKELVAKEMSQIQDQVEEAVNSAMDYAMEKTEKALERISNEKVMAVSDYSDTVMRDIHKNHEEAMFLYDVLNAKHSNIEEVEAKVDRKVKEAQEASKVAAAATREAQAATQVASSVAPVFRFLEDLPRPDKDANVIGENNTGTSAIRDREFDMSALKIQPEQDDRTEQEDKKDEDVRAYYRSVKKFSEMGLSAKEIAKELGKGVGEIELILRFYEDV